MTTISKTELINQVASRNDMSKTAAKAAVDVVFDCIETQLAVGNTVALLGFGTFAVNQRVARVGRNPRTGDPLNIAASKSVQFKAGKGLKDAVNV